MNILVTGVGGAPGMGAVEALRLDFGMQHKIVGIDCSNLSPIFYMNGWLDAKYIVPRIEEPNYIQKIKSICKKEKIDIILPCTDHEILHFALEKKEFLKEGIKIVVSPPETIRICRDKWLTYKNLSKSLPIVPSSIPKENINDAVKDIKFPVIIKPRKGWGTRDVFKAEDIDEVGIFLKKAKNPVIQQFLEGEEYTIDGLTDEKGNFLCAVPRKRVNILAGLSSIGKTIHEKDLIDLAKKITECLEICGPFNFQLKRFKGKPYIFEINARFAGTGILSVHAGVNLPALAIKSFSGLDIPSKIDFKEGFMITRYIEGVYLHQDAVFKNDN